MPETTDSHESAVLLVTGPDPKSFIPRFLLATVPVLLVIFSNAMRVILDSTFHTATTATASAITSSIPAYLNPSAIALDQYTSGIAGATDLTVYVIAPVGIFLLVIVVGWTLRLEELWTSSLLTLGLSMAAGLILAAMSEGVAVSGSFISILLQWIAFLVQPFSILAAAVVMIRTEKFRRSIRYTVTDSGVRLRGGVVGSQEHVIPAHQIGRVVLEQDFLGALFNYGTVIPQSMTRWGAETSFRGIGASAQKDNLGLGIGYARGREEASRHPLDCLYGIPDPKTAQTLIEQLMQSHASREDDQVSYLKKIYEAVSAGTTRAGPPASGEPQPERPGGGERRNGQGPAAIRLQESDLPDSYACTICGKKELPPYIGRDGKPYCSDHYPGKTDT